MQSTARIALKAALLAGLVAFAPPASSVILRQVAASGDAAPGTGAVYLGFGAPVTNASGRLAFTATLEQAGSITADNDLGLWVETPTGGSLALVLVQQQGSAAVGASGVWDAAAGPPSLNDAGQLAFRGSLTGPDGSGIWHDGSGALAGVAWKGIQADGLPSGVFYSGAFSEPSFNDAGQVAFHGGLSGASTAQALWSGGPGSLTLVALGGDLAPGSGGAAYSGFDGTLLNASGSVAFRSLLDDGGSGVYAGAAGSLQLVARNGSPAPGVTGGEFANFVAPDLADGGAVAFQAGLGVGVGGVGMGDDRGIWAGTPGAIALVAREGDTAPGAGGRVFESFSAPLVNAAGEVLFRAFLDAGSGLFLRDDQLGLVKVAASGDAAPGTDQGSGDASFGSFSDWSLSDDGQLMFEAALSGAAQGVNGTNDGSLWFVAANGALELVMREGQNYEIAPGDSAPVDGIDFFGASAARGRGLADGTNAAFGLSLVDGRAAVLPEPGVVWALALGALLLTGMRARVRVAAVRRG